MKFIKKLILLIQGSLPDYDEYIKIVSGLDDEIKKLRAERYDLTLKVEQAEKKVLKIPVSPFDSLDVEPIDRAERVLYVSSVDDFYESILKRKIQVSLSEIRGLLAGLPMENGIPHNITRNEYDYFLRGMEAFAWKIHDWATILQAERKVLQEDINN